jgi:nucleoside-diphosphate-sugar epimerase
VARILIAGCGCRGLALARALPEHVVRGTTRSPERVAELEAGGIEGVVADPDRLGTLVRALEGVGVVCWLMGSAVGSPEVNGARLSSLLEHLVDTPVRGFVYEGAGSVDASVLERGAQVVREASELWRIRAEVVTADPAAHDAWLEAMREAVERTMS